MSVSADRLAGQLSGQLDGLMGRGGKFAWNGVPRQAEEWRARAIAQLWSGRLACDVFVADSFASDGAPNNRAIICGTLGYPVAREVWDFDTVMAISFAPAGRAMYWDSWRGGDWFDFLVGESHGRLAGTRDIQPFLDIMQVVSSGGGTATAPLALLQSVQP